MAKAKRPRPYPELGRFVRGIRDRKGLTQLEVAAKGDMRNELLSRLELGENVEIDAYDRAARGMGFRGALEMFRSGGDDQTVKLLRMWRPLPDVAQKAVLRAVKQIREADEESSST